MSDGFSVYTFSHLPKGTPIGHIHLLHGMAEHIARYEQFVEFLVGKGYIVSGHDHRGHGKTAQLNGKLGYFADDNGFERVVQDVNEVVTVMRTAHEAPRFILFGHSMGSFIARRYIQLHGTEIDAVILSGTGDEPAITRMAGEAIANLSGKARGTGEPDHLLNKLVFNGFNKLINNPKTPVDWLTRDEEICEQYINDPTCGFVPTTQFFIDLFNGLKKINAKAEINLIPKHLPVLLFSGSEDPVGDYGKGVARVAARYDSAGIEDVTLSIFEGGRHEMLNETNRQHVFTFITDWIEGKL